MKKEDNVKNKIAVWKKDKVTKFKIHIHHTHISQVQGHLPHLSKSNDKLHQIVEASQRIVCTNHSFLIAYMDHNHHQLQDLYDQQQMLKQSSKNFQ